MKQIKRLGYLLTLVLCLMLPKAVLAASCPTTTLDQYLEMNNPGFSCTVGDLNFSNFSFFNINNNSNYIQVSSQSTGGQVGLAFTNMGVFGFSSNGMYGSGTNGEANIYFTATALNGLITGDSVSMTDYSTAVSGSGSTAAVSASFGGYGAGGPYVFCSNCSSPPSLTDSSTFVGITSASMSARAYASTYTMVVEPGPGPELGTSSATAYIGGITTLFTLSPSAVPIPAAAWLFGSGLLGLMGFARRKKV